MLMHEYAPPDLKPTNACFSAAIPAAKEGLSRTRREVHAWLAAQGVGEQADLAVLLVNELTTNAQKHAPGPARLRLFLGHALLRCEVADGLAARPRLITPDLGDEGGRGLRLVDMLALRWGSIPTARGKVVWFELAVTVTPSPARSHELSAEAD